MQFQSVPEWREHIIQNWKLLKAGADTLPLNSSYEKLVAIALLPVVPKDAVTLRRLLRHLATMRYGQPLHDHLKMVYSGADFTLKLEHLITKHLDTESLTEDQRESLDWVLVTVGALAGITTSKTQAEEFLKTIMTEIRQKRHETSAVRVQAGIISAGQNVVFAGQDVNIITTYYRGDKHRLKTYLTMVRSEWNIPISNILPGFTHQNEGTLLLHKLYTPVDIWVDADDDTLSDRRLQSIEQDLNDFRQPVLEAIATHPHIVITGGPGTGKSSLCRYIATCLAYACDTDAEQEGHVQGLELLGSAWIHGAILPLYVSLRNFCADKSLFPNTVEQGKAQCLLDYMRKTTGTFADELERYLLATDVPTQGAILILDGLDEVYSKEDRLILRQIIDNWAKRFTKCRILVTSRTYAYGQDAPWRLSKRFAVAELAPFSWKQMQHYIEGWYTQAALVRPTSFGGRDVAKSSAKMMATDLLKTILATRSLWPLARQPLMLALLTLIHEDNKRLPSKKAELYEKTVQLLDRWNIPSPDDTLAEKLSNLNLERIHIALKLVAFNLQKRQIQYQKDPALIERQELLEQFIKQQHQGTGLGASIEDVLEYLATRNGILVSDQNNMYRFPHLSVQEYLAACALIELYDECEMPPEAKVATDEDCIFPQNIARLLKQDPFRWHNVTLFAGSIIATGKGQDNRWLLIEELLPDTEAMKKTVDDNTLHCMVVASQIWAEAWIKPRNRLQNIVHRHLQRSLEIIQNDERLDAPDRLQILDVLARLQTGL